MKTRLGREAVKAGPCASARPARPRGLAPRPGTARPGTAQPHSPAGLPARLPGSSSGQGSQQSLEAWAGLGGGGGWGRGLILLLLVLISSASCIFWQNISLSFRPVLENFHGSAYAFSFLKIHYAQLF